MKTIFRISPCFILSYFNLMIIFQFPKHIPLKIKNTFSMEISNFILLHVSVSCVLCCILHNFEVVNSIINHTCLYIFHVFKYFIRSVQII